VAQAAGGSFGYCPKVDAWDFSIFATIQILCGGLQAQGQKQEKVSRHNNRANMVAAVQVR